MPTATIKSPMVIVMLWSKTDGKVGSDARGSSNTPLFSSSLSGMLRRKTTMLKNANGMSRRGKAIRYMTAGFLHAGGAGQRRPQGAPRRAKFRVPSPKLELGPSLPSAHHRLLLATLAASPDSLTLPAPRPVELTGIAAGLNTLKAALRPVSST